MTGVIPMEVGEHHVLHVSGIDSDAAERRDRGTNPGPATPFRACLVEAGVGHDGAAAAADRPDKEVEGHRRRVVVGKDQVIAFRAVGEMRIAKREDLVERRRHVRLLGLLQRCWRLPLLQAIPSVPPGSEARAC